MKTESVSPVSFTQLPPEARMLFFIMFQTMYGPEQPPAEQVRADLEAIWSTERLTMDVFNHPELLDALFEKYHRKHRAKASLFENLYVVRRQARRARLFSTGRHPVRRAGRTRPKVS